MGAKIEYLLFKLVKITVNILPRRVNHLLAHGLGSLLFKLVKKRRELAIKNIKSALDYSEEEARGLAKRVFQDVAIKFIETLQLENWTKADFNKKIKVEGLKYLVDAYEKDQGVILFTGHIGNWELLGTYLSALGYPMNAIARTHQNPKINQEILNIRQSRGAKVFDKYGKGVRKAFKSLLKKEMLLILGDQDAHEEGEFIEFFGRPASTPKGPVVFAQKTGALIVPIYLMREGYGEYRLLIKEAISVNKRADEQKMKAKLQELTTSLEDIIRDYPAQWLWLHRRWKTDLKEAAR